jgi:hypothetical protein
LENELSGGNLFFWFRQMIPIAIQLRQHRIQPGSQIRLITL